MKTRQIIDEMLSYGLSGPESSKLVVPCGYSFCAMELSRGGREMRRRECDAVRLMEPQLCEVQLLRRLRFKD